MTAPRQQTICTRMEHSPLRKTPAPYRIVPVTADLVEASWKLRLRALRDHPDAFGQPYDDAVALSAAEVQRTFETFWDFRDNRTFIALSASDELVGMTGVARHYRTRERHRMDIWGVYVAPEHRGQGLADRLLATAIDHARTREGVLQLHLQVVSSNLAAIRSYERAGFVRWGRMPRADIVDGRALDSDFMVLMLVAPVEPGTIQSKGTRSCLSN